MSQPRCGLECPHWRVLDCFDLAGACLASINCGDPSRRRILRLEGQRCVFEWSMGFVFIPSKWLGNIPVTKEMSDDIIFGPGDNFVGGAHDPTT